MSEEPTSLEERIGAALADDDLSSAELQNLLTELDDAIEDAKEAARLERERAFDPSVSPDPAAARNRMEDAAFTHSRLLTLLPRLERRYEEKRRAEKVAAWRAEYATVEQERNALAAELREVYPAVVAQLADLMARLAAFAGKLDALHAQRPSGASNFYLKSPELMARGLDDFRRDQPPLSKRLQLPDFVQSDRLLYPPPRDVSMFAPVPPPDRLHSANWAEAQQERARAAREEQDRLAAYYEQQRIAQERRERSQVGRC